MADPNRIAQLDTKRAQLNAYPAQLEGTGIYVSETTFRKTTGLAPL